MDNDRIWDVILDAIEQNRIVPIIGDEFFYVEEGQGLVNYKQYILNLLIQKFDKFNLSQNLKPDFNLVADSIKISNQMQSMMGSFKGTTSIYYEIGEIVKNTPIICDQCLVNFLSTFKFPLILSTSYIPGLESVLSSNCCIRAYDKTPRIDIADLELTPPTLYYLFGKCSKANKTYMVTEDDLLDYMHFWHNLETRPKNLSEYLSDKFLLLLGCSYPNWLFRFFWHSIKNFNLLSGNDGVKGIVASMMLDDDNELSRFLSRIDTRGYVNAKSFMTDLIQKRRVENVNNSILAEENNDVISTNNHDIFLSYSHEDREIAVKVAERFESFGAKVWFDSSSLVGSDLYDQVIQEKITSCQRFVPLLSYTTARTQRGYFRKEWSLALEELRFRLGSPYIAPVCIDNVNINQPLIPKEFRDAHVLKFHSDGFDADVKKLIRSFRQ